MRRLLVSILCVLLVWLPAASEAQSRKGVSLIRDDEIESYLRELSRPIFIKAGLDPRAIHIYIVNDPSINAFVSGGQNIFFHTGLLEAATDYAMLAGVIAHETGHITGGHLIRTQDELEIAQATSILGYVLGVTSMAVGSSQAGTAILTGTSHLAERQMAAFSRGHEQSADQAGVRYMKAAGYPLSGFARMMEVLYQKNKLHTRGLDPYRLTHPMTADRINFIEAELAKHDHIEPEIIPALEEKHERMRAKLIGFLWPKEKALARYPESNTGVTGHLARAVVYHRDGDVKKAIEQLSPLLDAAPQDPYLWELKGQILFENGRVAESIPAYEKALTLNQNGITTRIGLAVAILATESRDDSEAVTHLKRVTVEEPSNAFAWQQLGIAEGRTGNLAGSYVALAEHAFYTREYEEAEQYLELAERQKDKASAYLKRIQQLRDLVKREKKKAD